MKKLVLMFLVAATPALAAPAPRLPIQDLAQLPVVTRAPYDEHADANAQVAAAFTRARHSHKRVLIDLGGNWCLDCRLLAGVMETPQMRPFVARHFEVVTVDVGRFDQNMDIPASYGVKGRLAGVPAVLIVDPKTNKLINAGRETALADARAMTPQAVADWLAGWVG